MTYRMWAQAVKQNLLPTPFEGCKGEPLNYKFPSGMKVQSFLLVFLNLAGQIAFL